MSQVICPTLGGSSVVIEGEEEDYTDSAKSLPR